MRQKLKNELYKAGESSTVETGSNLTKEAILDPDKMKIDELGMKSTSEMITSLLKCIEMRAAGHALGKITDHANLQFAKRDLFESAKTLPKENYLRLIKHTKELEERLNNPKETAKTLREISQFFKPRESGLDLDLAAVPDADELKHLGQMTLYEVAYPDKIHQGKNDTCNATVIQKQLAFNSPFRYAQVAKDAARYDSFATADGATFKPSKLGAFITDEEGQGYWERKNDLSYDMDLHRPLYRRPSEKVMQTVIVNSHWNRMAREINVIENAEGLFIAPPKTEGSFVKKFAPGEVAFFGTEDRHQLSFKRGEEWIPFRKLHQEGTDDDLIETAMFESSPHIGSEHIEDMYNQVAGQGNFDQGFVLIGPVPKGANLGQIEDMRKSQTFVEDESMLKQILMTRFSDNRGATAIAVDAQKLDPNAVKGGGHIILGIYDPAEDNCRIFNSWGRREPNRTFKNLHDCLLEEIFDGTPER